MWNVQHVVQHAVQQVKQHSPLLAAQRAWPDTTIVHVPGCVDTTSNDTAGIAAAARAAKEVQCYVQQRYAMRHATCDATG